MDRTARTVLVLTRRMFNIMLLFGIILLAAAADSPQPYITVQLAEGMAHAACRVAAMGAVTGLTADIVLRREG